MAYKPDRSGARHPQPQGGRGEPGALARARIRTRTLASTQSDPGPDPDPGFAPDSCPQPAPEAPHPARAPAARGLGLRTRALSQSLSLLPGVGGPPLPRGWPGRDFTAHPRPPSGGSPILSVVLGLLFKREGPRPRPSPWTPGWGTLLSAGEPLVG